MMACQNLDMGHIHMGTVAVGNVLWDSGCPSSCAELIVLLRGRYGNNNQAEHFWMELKT